MVRVLIIYDFVQNGKGGTEFFLETKPDFAYSCSKMRYTEFTNPEKHYNLFKKISIIIFDYNEEGICGYIHQNKIPYSKIVQIREQLIVISKYVTKKFPKIKVINNPIRNEIFEHKFLLYQKIQKHKLKVKTPKAIQIKTESDLKTVEYPSIIILSRSSGGNDRKLCNTREQGVKTYEDLRNKMADNDGKPVNQIVAIQYIESQLFNHYFCARAIVFNQKIIYYFPRLSKKWMTNQYTQITNPDLILKAFQYLENLIKSDKSKNKIKKMIGELRKIAGNSIYAADIIFKNDQPYLCEIGYKFFPGDFYRLSQKLMGLNQKLDQYLLDRDKYCSKMVNAIIKY